MHAPFPVERSEQDRPHPSELARSHRAEGVRDLHRLYEWAEALPDFVEGRPVIGFAEYAANVARACLENGFREEAEQLGQKAFAILQRLPVIDSEDEKKALRLQKIPLRAEIAARIAPVFVSLGMISELQACRRMVTAHRESTGRQLGPSEDGPHALELRRSDAVREQEHLSRLELKMNESILRLAVDDPAGEEQIRDLLANAEHLISDRAAITLQMRAVRLLLPFPELSSLQQEVLAAFWRRLNLLPVSEQGTILLSSLSILREAAPKRLHAVVLASLEEMRQPALADAYACATFAYLAAEMDCFTEARKLGHAATRLAEQELLPSDTEFVKDGHTVLKHAVSGRLARVMECVMRAGAALARAGQRDDAAALYGAATDLWNGRFLQRTDGFEAAEAAFLTEMGQATEAIRQVLEAPHPHPPVLIEVIHTALRRRAFDDADRAMRALTHLRGTPGHLYDPMVLLAIAREKMRG